MYNEILSSLPLVPPPTPSFHLSQHSPSKRHLCFSLFHFPFSSFFPFSSSSTTTQSWGSSFLCWACIDCIWTPIVTETSLQIGTSEACSYCMPGPQSPAPQAIANSEHFVSLIARWSDPSSQYLYFINTEVCFTLSLSFYPLYSLPLSLLYSLSLLSLPSSWPPWNLEYDICSIMNGFLELAPGKLLGPSSWGYRCRFQTLPSVQVFP